MKKIASILGVLSVSIAASAQAGVAGLNWGNSAGSAGSDESRCVTVDASDYSYYSGYFTGTVDFDPGTGTQTLTSSGGRDIYIAKYDPNGAYVWAIQLSGTNNEFGSSIKLDGSGNIYLTGNFRGTVDFDPSGSTANLSASGLWDDAFVAKYDNNGNYQWAFKIGSSMTDNGLSIELDGSNNVYVAGNFYGTTDFNPGAGTYNLSPNTSGGIVYPAGYVAKYNSSGTFQWAFKINSTKSTNCTALVHDGSSYLYVTGSFAGTADFDPSASTANIASLAGSADAFLAKYSSAGAYQWAGEMGGTTADVGTALTYDGSYVYVAGDFTGTADFIPGSGYLAFTSFGGTDIFLGRYELNGTCFWIKQIGGEDQEHCNSIDFKDGYIFTTGWFDGICDFDPTPADQSLVSAGKEDVFLAIYQSSTSFITFATRFGSGNADIGYGIDASGSWSFWLAAKYTGANISFDPLFYVPPYSSVSNSTDCMMARYYWGIINNRQQGSQTVSLPTDRSGEDGLDNVPVTYYPNPASSFITVQNVPVGSVVELFSVTGQLMESVLASEDRYLTFDITNYPDGLYIMRITGTDGTRKDEKVVIHH